MSGNLAERVATAIRGTRVRNLPAGLRPSGRLVAAARIDTGIVCVTSGNRYDVTSWYRTRYGWARLDITSTTNPDDVPALAATAARRLG